MVNRFGSVRQVGMTVALLLVAMLIVIPLFLILLSSVYENSSWNFFNPFEVMQSGGLAGIFLNSMLLGVLVVIGATIFAFPLAFIMSKTDVGKHSKLDIVFMIPFMTPPYIGSMGWILFMQPNGYFEQFFPMLKTISSSFFSLGGMVLIMSLHLFPFLYFMLKNTLLQIGSSKEEAAAVHGGSFFYRLRKIILPLLVSSYVMGALLIFVKTIAEFGTPATFGRRIGFHVLTSEIHKFISSWPIDFSSATALSSLLLSACMLIWYMQNVLNRKYSYAMVSGKGVKSKRYTLSIYVRVVAWIYVIGLLIVSIGIPYFSILIASLSKLRGGGLQLHNFTTSHYEALFTIGSPGLEALWNSFLFSLITAIIAVMIGVFLALMIRKGKKSSEKWLDMCGMLPNMVPGIVMVVGLILFWNSPYIPLSIYNTPVMVIVTYVVLFLPYTVQYVKASLGQIDDSLVQAGSIFSGNYMYIFRKIIFPLIIPGILAGWAMTFTISIRELVASLLVLPPSVETSATFIFAQFEQGEVSIGMAMAVVSVGLTTLCLLLLQHMEHKRKGVA
ncbi:MULTISPECIES: ABC transporter permease [Bacillus cereus group]|uniref:Putative ABC transporter, permease protein n=1 Tax=Bacillus cereus (strain AH187) TaxID=405534 RepID=B7HLZ2_BACC7|nr:MULTISPECIES: iron ABC transporter permease [Bacillus cereus group]ACJ79072.1 putative ABC transporter, permease protein [Bacillus cereus AH187]MBR9741966.1 iron ABC transporter permease [Bacillus paranthracis]MDA1984811.1 iron ABC transporter permease [Bacillus cereus group sp. Bcc13]MDX5777791.1 iron ABC transporter permease [Bacillus cereus group sp. DSM 4312]NHA30879.1 ABC transporter permease [Bacillus paranthracis]